MTLPAVCSIVDSAVSLFFPVSHALIVTWQLKLNDGVNCFVRSSIQFSSVEMLDDKLQGLIEKLLGFNAVAVSC